MADAAWAQANGIFEFQIGNEEELHLWRHPVSLVRDGSNTVTATFAEAHGFTSANPINIWTVNPANGNTFGFSGSITVTSATTFTYTKSGTAGSVAHPENMYIGNMPENTIQTNMKTLATYIKANSIYTRGNISYTTTGQYFMDEWYTLGRGDIDILAFNVYTNQSGWDTSITNQVSWWGADHTYLTEFGLNTTSIDSYSTDEAVQAAGLTSMITTIKAAGITRATFFDYIGDDFGARKSDGTYRKIWDVLVTSQPPSDTSPPTGGSIIYTGGNITSTSVPLTVNDGTDAGSGINTSSRIIQRKSAPLSNGKCGSYGAWLPIPLTGSYPNFTDNTVSSGNCYQYQYLVSDNTGNQATYNPLDLGMVAFSTSLPYDGTWSVWKGYLDDLISHGFTSLRIDIPQYYETTDVENRSKPGVLIAIGKGAKVTWGLSGDRWGGAHLTSTTWPAYHDAVVAAAQWAQANGVYEFQIGNEEESHNEGTDLSDAQLITNLKSLATDVKKVFTRGKVSYSCFHGNISDWVKAGKGDIDILASNVYMSYGGPPPNAQPWQNEINALLGAFGLDGTYITEFGPNSSSLHQYSTDEAVQAAAVQTELDYMKSVGMKRADFYEYYDSGGVDFGARQADSGSPSYTPGAYGQLWNTLKSNVNTVKVTVSNPSGKTGDLNNDNKVDILDLSKLISSWGATSGVADINKDGIVNVFDLSILLSNWGT